MRKRKNWKTYFVLNSIRQSDYGNEKKIELLKQNPFPSDSKRIVNVEDKVFRIRVGKYRILYRIENDKIINDEK